MNSKNFQTFFECGSSKIRAGVFNRDNEKEAFYAESEFFTNQSNLELKIEEIIMSFEKDTDEYIDNINLMLDSPKMLSISISVSKKLDGSKLKQPHVQFLVQEAKQQILKYYTDYNISHIIINNYKIDDVDYSYLPDEIKCHSISLDILFICLPSGYAKSINYKENLNLVGNISFIDVGFNKTSIISYSNDKILSLDILPIGGNHITKDISQILKINLEQSEQMKRNFVQNPKLLNEKDISIETLQKIIFARTEEILELCSKSIKSNSLIPGNFKMVLMGEGSKILDNKYKDEISFTNNIDFLEETLENICQSGLKLGMGLNKQEVVVVPKNQIKLGFFEKLFHFFK